MSSRGFFSYILFYLNSFLIYRNDFFIFRISCKKQEEEEESGFLKFNSLEDTVIVEFLRINVNR